MPPLSNVGGLILAGGRSSRFGGDKAAADLAGKALMDHVIDRLSPQCAALAISGDSVSREGLVRLVDDPALASGPLAGICAGLNWASSEGFDWLVTAPCDTPFLPETMVERLVAASHDASVNMAMCVTADGQHPLCAIWRPILVEPLTEALKSAHPPVRGFAAQCGAAQVDFDDARSFMNVNTVEDMREALAFHAASQ